MSTYLRRSRAPIQRQQSSPTPQTSSTHSESKGSAGSASPGYLSDRPLVRLGESQSGLKVGAAGDSAEREADRVADEVTARPLRSAPPSIQRSTGEAGGQTDAAPASVDHALSSPGSALEPGLQENMEQRLGHDFSGVRVHSGATAERSAQDVSADAYTVGQDIVFGAGGFRPETREGERLIAHELTHVVQQSGGQSQAVAPSRGGTVMRQPAAQAPPQPQPAERTEEGDGPPEWVLSIMGDRSLSLTTKLLAAATGAGFAGPEPKGEEEFLNDLVTSDKAEEQAAGEGGMSSEKAGELLTATIERGENEIRERGVKKAMSLMGADWHAAEGSEARNKAKSLHPGDPQNARTAALNAGMVWAYEQQESIEKVRVEAEIRYKKTKSEKARQMMEAASEVQMALQTSLNKSLVEQQTHSPGNPYFAEDAWNVLGSEKAKKHLERLGFPLAWFTTCVTMASPVAEAAGVDTKKWGALDIFDPRRKERFKQADAANAWVPAEYKQQPKPGDILIFVSYQKDAYGKMQKEVSKAFFQHLAILVEPVSSNGDGTEKWITADGGKGSSHKGEDKTGLTTRRYNPNLQQFVPEKHANMNEAAEGGRYLLGFWSLPRLPMRAPTPAKTGAGK